MEATPGAPLLDLSGKAIVGTIGELGLQLIQARVQLMATQQLLEQAQEQIKRLEDEIARRAAEALTENLADDRPGRVSGGIG